MKSRTYKICLLLLSLSLQLFLQGNEKPRVYVLYDNLGHKIPKVTWYDGFVKGIQLLEEKYEMIWLNTRFQKVQDLPFDLADAVLIKSDFGSELDMAVRKYIPLTTPKALLISSTKSPFEPEFYDVLFYETNWYRQKILDHPCTIHGFGVNTEVMQPNNEVEKVYDYIMVADMHCPGKRVEKFLDKPGKKLLISGFKGIEEEVSFALNEAGIDIIDFVRFDKIALYYQMSRKAYNASTVPGGGDRFLLEARACGLEVEIEPENPKLQELIEGPIYDHRYYANQIDLGLQVMIKKKAYYDSQVAIRGISPLFAEERSEDGQKA